uniref:Uncharacterized protein n=1 Tax=Oryza nivara TaxID=4536 RepID=A0A0E0HEP1_ORYNI
MGSCQMKAQDMVSRSSCSKNKVFGSLPVDSIPEIDPSYRLFLEHLREDGNGYVLDAPRGDHGSPVFLRYAQDHASNGYANAKSGTNITKSSLRRSHCNQNSEGPGVTSDKAGSANAGHCFSLGTSFAMETSEIDESYATFLRLLKIKNGLMVIEPEPGVTIVYGQAEETPVGYDELRIATSTNGRDSLMTAFENMGEENAMNTDGDGLGKINNSASEREMDGLALENMGGQDLVCIDEHGLPPCTELSDLNNLCHEGAYMPWIDKPLACNPIDADDYETDDPTAIEIIQDGD